MGTREKNKDGKKEEMISCADCGNSGITLIIYIDYITVLHVYLHEFKKNLNDLNQL